jgi:hypothetical protein
MKSLFPAFVLFLFLTSCGSNSNEAKEPATISAAEGGSGTNALQDSTNWTTVQWTDSVQNFGKVTDGEKIIISFHFKNTGSKPLVITNVSASCGCTVPEKPEAPIAPGEEGVIKAEFNSSGRVGMASKYVNVSCNTATQNYTLLFEGEVLPKKQ